MRLLSKTIVLPILLLTCFCTVWITRLRRRYSQSGIVGYWGLIGNSSVCLINVYIYELYMLYDFCILVILTLQTQHLRSVQENVLRFE